MHGTILRSPWAAPSGLVLMLLVGTPIVAAQAPGASPPRQQPPAAQPNQRAEQERLARQVEELRRAGRFDEAVAVAERALELERGTGEAMGGQVAEALARLAELHELRGDWVEAVGRRKEAQTVRMQVDGKEHWRTADARLALAFAEKVAGLGQADRARLGGALRREQEAAQLEEQGKFAEAERVVLEALETYRAVVGPESVEVARAWHRIGRCRSARNDAGGAKEANERALMIRRKVLPGTHPDLGRSLNNLGLAEGSLGNKRRARELLEEAVRLWWSSLESSSPLTAMGLTNLGTVQFELREYAAAKQSLEQALAIRRKSLPPDHPDIAQSLGNLGVVQYGLREYAAAKQSFEQALAIRRKSLPPDHPDIAQSLNNLGVVQYTLREYAAAKQSHEQALAIRRKSLPPDHPDIATSLNNLGVVQYTLREYAAAKQSHEQALAIFRKSLPPDHPLIAFSLWNLGRLSLRSGVGVGDAVPGLSEATDLFQAEQLRLAVAQAEQEQLASAALARICLSNLLDATLITRAEPASVYDRVVRVKGSVTALQRWARQARDPADPDTARLLYRLRQVSQQLVGLSMDQRPVQTKSESKDLPNEIRTLSAERDDLERATDRAQRGLPHHPGSNSGWFRCGPGGPARGRCSDRPGRLLPCGASGEGTDGVLLGAAGGGVRGPARAAGGGDRPARPDAGPG
ncbi:MAG: tetratricopeptide repeat protein [Isosphaeraceae bacterium]